VQKSLDWTSTVCFDSGLTCSQPSLQSGLTAKIVNMAFSSGLTCLKFRFDSWWIQSFVHTGNVLLVFLHDILLYSATESVRLTELHRGWADGRILVAYLSWVYVPFGTSLVAVWMQGWQRLIFRLRAPIQTLILAHKIPVVYDNLEKTDAVFSDLI